MKNRFLILMSGIAVVGITSCAKPAYQQPDAPIQEVPFTQDILVTVSGRLVLKRTAPYPFLLLLRNVRKTVVSIISPLRVD